jgi:hypothetical protein
MRHSSQARIASAVPGPVVDPAGLQGGGHTALTYTTNVVVFLVKCDQHRAYHQSGDEK